VDKTRAQARVATRPQPPGRDGQHTQIPGTDHTAGQPDQRARPQQPPTRRRGPPGPDRHRQGSRRLTLWRRVEPGNRHQSATTQARRGTLIRSAIGPRPAHTSENTDPPFTTPSSRHTPSAHRLRSPATLNRAKSDQHLRGCPTRAEQGAESIGWPKKICGTTAPRLPQSSGVGCEGLWLIRRLNPGWKRPSPTWWVRRRGPRGPLKATRHARHAHERLVWAVEGEAVFSGLVRAVEQVATDAINGPRRKLCPRVVGDRCRTRAARPELDHLLHLWVDHPARGLPPGWNRALGESACQ
jgi:hypothetical protein